MGNLHLDTAAEREANEVGRKYMNSTDVVGDMSRDFNADLSSVNIHTGSSAASGAAQRGVEAYSTGTDIFFGDGMFNQNTQLGRGMLAHELTHSLQQGVGGGASGVTQSAPLGAEQGFSLWAWIKGLFGGKKEKTPEEKAWDKEKQKRLAALDAEDAQHLVWKQKLEEEQAAIPDNVAAGIDGNPSATEYSDDDIAIINITEMTQHAKDMGWEKYHDAKPSEQFNKEITTNFFREASGISVSQYEDGGDTMGKVRTTRRSIEQMLEVFYNHDEETTLRFLEPLMNLSATEFMEKYPMHKMNAQERRDTYFPMRDDIQQYIGIKQWGEKYGFPLLSEDNQKKFDKQCMLLMELADLYMGMYTPGLSASMEQKHEEYYKTLDSRERPYSSTDLDGAKQRVKARLSADGDVIPYAEFASAMEKIMPKYGNNAAKIAGLSRNIPGLIYNAADDTVSSPIPLADLNGFARGDKKVLNRYADKLRSMNWRREDGGVRRAGMYESSEDEFMANFEEDFEYFSDMKSTAYLLKVFGGQRFFDRQKDAHNIINLDILAESTYEMMKGRSDRPSAMAIYDRRKAQYGKTAFSPTWVRRQLLESQSAMVNESGARKGAGGKDYYSSSGAAIGEMVANADNTNPELLKDPKIREMALKGFQQGFGNMLAEYDNTDFTSMTSVTFRGNASGELNTYNTVMKANSGDLISRLSEHVAGKEATDGLVDECLNMICDDILNTASPLHDMVLGGLEATQRSAHFKDNPEQQSKYLMNNVVLRVLAPQLAPANLQVSQKIMKFVNSGTSEASKRLRSLLAS